MPLDSNLLEIVACPICKGKLVYDKEHDELICKADRLAYPIDQGIPVLLEDKARDLTSEELPK
ncbi:Trm112 family protein [Celerinatantimonas sp. MCCC 1A17872]|uniref:Trm112 family protein n=1 Tax=Celerinatantimonas sp. MCCC 1A17872 TaxID=3177514 RepID=UPI0038C80F4A